MGKGEEIYGESILIIESLLKDNADFEKAYSEAERAVVKRVIHATSDISYAETMFFTGGSAERSIDLVREKISAKEAVKIVCDSEMPRAGISRNINKNAALDLNCYIGGGFGPPGSKNTKSAVSIRAAIKKGLPDIIAVGNAPTALVEAMKISESLYKDSGYAPSLIVGMPVGFVGASESKKMLYENKFFNAIGNFGNLGGSSSAAAAVNALLRGSL